MHAATHDLPIAVDVDEVTIRGTEWGDWHVEHMTVKTLVDMTPLLKGLPHDMCQCPHWGYLLRGTMRVRYPDREEVIEGGQAYYLAPGHVPVMEAGTELLEFSPKGPYQVSMDAASRNYMALQEA